MIGQLGKGLQSDRTIFVGSMSPEDEKVRQAIAGQRSKVLNIVSQ